MKWKNIIFIFTVLFIWANLVVAQTNSSQDTLKQYISNLQKNPNDNALREKIIRHVQTMKPKPAVPEEAERFMVRGTAAVKNAKDSNDFKDAVNEFEKATLAAPWLVSAYYNLGIAQDKAGMYPDAIKSLKLYLLANPNASDAKAVKNLMYEIEYKQEKAAKESSPEAIAARERMKFDEFLKKMNGRRYAVLSDGNIYRLVVDVRGKTLVVGRLFKNDPEPYHFPSCSYIEIQGRVSTCTYHDNELGLVESTYTISDDGDRITGHTRYQGKDYESIYLYP